MNKIQVPTFKELTAKSKKYYFITYLSEDGYGTFCAGMFSNCVTRRHPIKWSLKHVKAVLFYKEISKKEYLLGKKNHWNYYD